MIDLEAKAVGIVIAFAALTIVLSAVKIPTIFWPQQNFRLWEIPIVTAFLLFEFRVGFHDSGGIIVVDQGTIGAKVINFARAYSRSSGGFIRYGKMFDNIHIR